MTHQRSQQQIDAANAKFWSGLCGTLLAQGVGVTDASAQSLARFDRGHMKLFPYLDRYLAWRSGERVLEIGLVGVTIGIRPFAVGVSLNRALFLRSVARLAGLDLYVTATR